MLVRQGRRPSGGKEDPFGRQHRRGRAIAGESDVFRNASLRRRASGSICAGQRRDIARCIIGSRGGGAGSLASSLDPQLPFRRE
jgi:hypothetical protein